jgi:rhodanese-related sulfurtransferase
LPVPVVIFREEVQRLVSEEGAQLVEVLPREDYDSEHIAGAINIPLKELNAHTAARLDRSRPVITYCNDFT